MAISMTDSFTIPRTLANKLLSIAQGTPDAEVCGLISKTNDNKYKVYPIENIAKEKSCVFEMEPQQQIHAFKNMREEQEALFGIFHSHPHSDALPSTKDMDEASYSDALNIIISLDTKGVLDMRGYFYNNRTFTPVELTID